MAIPAGARLGPYEVLSAIGAGGMGEVYRARDSKLGRDVALKVLPSAFVADAERMARFEREARLLAALNHPNIAAIYGLEESAGMPALVMELVEGPTLADRIATGPIPLDEALPIAEQIAEALEYAHERGVIHRDLKPANIKVKADGTVKVLDFGLAKALTDDPAAIDMNNSPTLTIGATMQGVILGTAAYMSPEQAKGKPVDRRADIWAFGALVYEMLTGEELFRGETVADTMASAMKEEPALEKLPSNTPPPIRSLLRRCLDKNLRRRLSHIAEARMIIEDVLSGAAGGEERPRAPIGRLALPGISVMVGVALLAAAIAGIAAWILKPPPTTTPLVSRFAYDLPQGLQFNNIGRTVIALSPDGSRFVYNSSQGLYLRSMDQLDAHLIPGTEASLTNPFFSPDGQWIGYWQDGQLKKIAISGGAAVTICPATNPYGVSWMPDNTIFFAQPEGIRRVSGNGGMPELVIKAGESEQIDGPQLLPGGEWVLFAVQKGTLGWDEAHIVVQSLKTKERRDVWPGGSDAHYVSTEHIVYALKDGLFAIPFDLATLSVRGSATPVTQGIFRAVTGMTASANYGVSDSAASLVYVNSSEGSVTISWMDREGNFTPIRKSVGHYADLALSPDGKRLAVTTADAGKTDIWIDDLERDSLTRLTFNGSSHYPFWTPDGRRIVYASLDNGVSNLWWTRADGSGEPQHLTESGANLFPGSWRPDGKVLAFFQRIGAKNDIFTLTMEGDEKSGWKPGQPVPFANSRFQEILPAFSPDGRWLAYTSDESGQLEVYVRPFPGPGGKWQVSTGGGVKCIWSPNGKELFYNTLDNTRIIVASYTASGGTFRAGTPQLWSTGQFTSVGQTFNNSLHPDGKRFAVLKAVDTGASNTPRVNIVLNWFEELKQKAPAGKK